MFRGLGSVQEVGGGRELVLPIPTLAKLIILIIVITFIFNLELKGGPPEG